MFETDLYGRVRGEIYERMRSEGLRYVDRNMGLFFRFAYKEGKPYAQIDEATGKGVPGMGTRRAKQKFDVFFECRAELLTRVEQNVMRRFLDPHGRQKDLYGTGDG